VSTPTSRYESPSNEQDLVLAWIRRARESQLTHYAMAEKLSKMERWFGVPVIIITAVVGTSVFSSITTDAISPIAKVAVGMTSIAAAVLSALQTFFKHAERAEKHRSSGARFASVRRKLEAVYARHEEENERSYVDTLRDELDRLAEDAPNVPEKEFQKIQRRELDQESHSRTFDN